VYTAVAFVIWQAAEIAVPGLNLPAWVLTLVIVLTVLGFPIAVVLAWAFDITPAGVERTREEGAAEAGKRPSPPRLSVAVLPFENLSADPENEYFSDGISEELLNTLARVPGLRVAARTSSFAFKRKGAAIGEIGEALKVAHVVEGSVRRVGDRVRITAQLIDVADGYHLWSEGFDRELGDILMVQREIAESIGETLEAGLTRGWEDVRHTGRRVDPRAYDQYLRARFCSQRLTRESLEQAIHHYREVLSIDPGFAPAYAGMATAYLWLGDAYLSPLETTAKAVEALGRAIALDPNLAEAHATRGYVRAIHEWRWDEGRREMERALELNPNLAEAHNLLAHVKTGMRDRSGAISSAKRAFELDPLSAAHSHMLEWFYLFDGQPDAAIRQYQVTQELAPGMIYHDSILGRALSEQGRYDEAMQAFEAAERTLGRPSTGKGIMLAWMGRKQQALEIAGELEQTAEISYIMPELIAELYAVCGERERAFDWLRRGLDARSAGVEGLVALRGFEALHDDPRFQDILRETGRSNS
jgi:TolB-like protein/Tfp pilus assembly protein PilF